MKVIIRFLLSVSSTTPDSCNSVIPFIGSSNALPNFLAEEVTFSPHKDARFAEFSRTRGIISLPIFLNAEREAVMLTTSASAMPVVLRSPKAHRSTWLKEKSAALPVAL